MKYLFITLLALFSISLFANDTTVVNATKAERIIDKYTGKISDAFNQGLDKVTPVAKQGFEIAVKLQIAKGLGYMIVPFVTVLLIILGFKFYNKSKTLSKDRYNSDFFEVLSVLCLVLGGIGVIGSMPAIYHGLLHLIAPEWFAIQEIIHLFK